MEAGCLKVLGYDHDEKSMFAFEHTGGLATTIGNILINADIVICFKDHLSKEDYDTVRPGQLFVSLLSEGKIDWIQLEKGGVREFIQCDYSKLALLFPGIIQGLIKSGADSFEDGMLVNLAKAMVKLVENNYTFPDIFSDIHEKVAALIHKHITEKKAT